MKSVQVQMSTRARRAAAFAAILVIASALLVASNVSRAQEGRARRTTPTPTQQQGKPATTASPQQTPTPKATPKPVMKTSGGTVNPGQIVLPDAPPDMANPLGVEINEGDSVKIDTDLVNLNVRVIDRNNRPIGNVTQNEISVYENGVLQPI